MTFAELYTSLELEMFPDRLAENWVPQVHGYLKEGLADLQQWVTCLRVNHTDVYPFRATHFKCGMSLVCAPPGKITKLYTIPTGDYCQPIQYARVPFDLLQCWSRRFVELSGTPPNAWLPTLPLGIWYPEAVTDGNPEFPSQFGRALRGVYAYKDGDRNIYIAPWLQSSESVCIEWNGRKRTWSDADIVSSGSLSEDVWRSALKAWVLAKYAMFAENDYDKNKAFMLDYSDAFRSLDHECRQQTENLDPTYACAADAGAARHAEYLALQAAGTVTVAETALIYAVIGDQGLAGQPQLDVSTLVKEWNPALVLGTGDSNYETGSSSTIDANMGYWRKFIYPYKGIVPLLPGETDATSNQLFVAIGNHDLDDSFPPAPLLDYLTLPGNGRFYSVVHGYVEWFFVDSGYTTAGVLVETMGNTAVSIQAAWLQANLARSTAKFKVVIFHHPPWTSGLNYYDGTPAMRWPFKEWGASLVASGHSHAMERLTVTGLDYITVGNSGKDLVCFHDPPLETSVMRFCADFGAVKISVTCTQMLVEFWTRAGVLVDSFTITKTTPF